MIRKAELISFYNSILSYRYATHAKELPSLDEFLSLSLEQSPNPVSSFDEKTDEFLEIEALKRLEERQKAHG